MLDNNQPSLIFAMFAWAIEICIIVLLVKNEISREILGYICIVIGIVALWVSVKKQRQFWLAFWQFSGMNILLGAAFILLD